MPTLVHYLSLLSELVGSGVGVWAITEGVKKVKSIPINPGDTAKIRTVAAALASVASLLVDYSNGSLNVTTVQGVLTAVVGAALAWATAHTTFKLVSGPSSTPSSTPVEPPAPPVPPVTPSP